MRISESEAKIMGLIWEKGGPVTTDWLAQRLAGTEWKATTVLTFLSRLEKKGFLTITRQGRQNFYQAAISREAYQREETESFVRQIHGGSYRSLLRRSAPPAGFRPRRRRSSAAGLRAARREMPNRL